MNITQEDITNIYKQKEFIIMSKSKIQRTDFKHKSNYHIILKYENQELNVQLPILLDTLNKIDISKIRLKYLKYYSTNTIFKYLIYRYKDLNDTIINYCQNRELNNDKVCEMVFEKK
jgi:Leucine-rich repeat (LRR) protein